MFTDNIGSFDVTYHRSKYLTHVVTRSGSISKSTSSLAASVTELVWLTYPLASLLTRFGVAKHDGNIPKTTILIILGKFK